MRSFLLIAITALVLGHQAQAASSACINAQAELITALRELDYCFQQEAEYVKKNGRIDGSFCTNIRRSKDAAELNVEEFCR